MYINDYNIILQMTHAHRIFLNEWMNEISNFSKDGEILICGDFNARTGKLWDFINQDSVND